MATCDPDTLLSSAVGNYFTNLNPRACLLASVVLAQEYEGGTDSAATLLSGAAGSNEQQLNETQLWGCILEVLCTIYAGTCTANTVIANAATSSFTKLNRTQQRQCEVQLYYEISSSADDVDTILGVADTRGFSKIGNHDLLVCLLRLLLSAGGLAIDVDALLSAADSDGYLSLDFWQTQAIYLQLLCEINNAAPPVNGTTVNADFVSRISANGGAAPSAAHQTAVVTFVDCLIAAGIWSKMKLMNVIMPDNLIAALTPLIVGTGNDPWTNHNLVLADLGVNGFTGNGSNKYMDTGFIPDSSLTSTSAGLSCYIYFRGAAGRHFFSVLNGTNNIFGLAYVLATGLPQFNCWKNINPDVDWITGAAPAGNEFFFGASRTDANTIKAYSATSFSTFSNFKTGSGAAQTGAVFGTYSMFAMARNNSGTADFPINGTASYFDVHEGLTSTEHQALFTCVQALRISLGGGYR